jgi:ribosomal protein L37AE/L43A
MFCNNETILRQSIRRGVCPDCGCFVFLARPCGGICQNIECRDCGADFTGGPFPARIGWNHSGRWKKSSEGQAASYAWRNPPAPPPFHPEV